MPGSDPNGFPAKTFPAKSPPLVHIDNKIMGGEVKKEIYNNERASTFLGFFSPFLLRRRWSFVGRVVREEEEVGCSKCLDGTRVLSSTAIIPNSRRRGRNATVPNPGTLPLLSSRSSSEALLTISANSSTGNRFSPTHLIFFRLY